MLSVGLISSFFLSLTVFSFSSFLGLVVWGWGLRIDGVFSLSPDIALHADLTLIMMIIIIIGLGVIS